MMFHCGSHNADLEIKGNGTEHRHLSGPLGNVTQCILAQGLTLAEYEDIAKSGNGMRKIGLFGNQVRSMSETIQIVGG